MKSNADLRLKTIVISSDFNSNFAFNICTVMGTLAFESVALSRILNREMSGIQKKVRCVS